MTAVPFLKFAGGKRQLLPEIRKYVPKRFGRYFEPFVGGGAVFFDLVASGRIRRAALGDANEELVETYCSVRDDVDHVLERLRAHAGKHSEEYYYKVRAMRGSDPASRMIYLNKTCFNGLYRVNKKGAFNVPFGGYKNPTICDEANLRACSAALGKANWILVDDFEITLSGARRGDFAYCDPPYLPVSETSDFTSYTRDGFTLDDQKRLAECARRLKKRGVHVLLSNADVPVVRKIYKGFEIHRVEARRAINSKGAKRGNVGEVLIT